MSCIRRHTLLQSHILSGGAGRPRAHNQPPPIHIVFAMNAYLFYKVLFSNHPPNHHPLGPVAFHGLNDNWRRDTPNSSHLIVWVYHQKLLQHYKLIQRNTYLLKRDILGSNHNADNNHRNIVVGSEVTNPTNNFH